MHCTISRISRELSGWMMTMCSGFRSSVTDRSQRSSRALLDLSRRRRGLAEIQQIVEDFIHVDWIHESLRLPHWTSLSLFFTTFFVNSEDISPTESNNSKVFKIEFVVITATHRLIRFISLQTDPSECATQRGFTWNVHRTRMILMITLRTTWRTWMHILVSCFCWWFLFREYEMKSWMVKSFSEWWLG